MDINELQNKIMEILNEIEAGEYYIPIVNETKQIQIIQLMIDNRIDGLRPALDDMKKAINKLELGGKLIILFADILLVKIMKIFNSSDSPKAILEKDITNDEVFICSFIRKADEELLKAYKKYKIWIDEQKSLREGSDTKDNSLK